MNFSGWEDERKDIILDIDRSFVIEQHGCNLKESHEACDVERSVAILRGKEVR
jgi:hypothetical protein